MELSFFTLTLLHGRKKLQTLLLIFLNFKTETDKSKWQHAFDFSVWHASSQRRSGDINTTQDKYKYKIILFSVHYVENKNLETTSDGSGSSPERVAPINDEPRTEFQC